MQEIITERPNLFEPNDYIVFYIGIGREVIAEDLAAAVKAAYRANEATMSKVLLRTDGAACYEKMSCSGCKVKILQGDWREIIRENEKIPFKLENGEFVRSFVISVGEKLFLLVMAHHLVGDGKALVYFIESVMNALAGKELEYKPLTLLTRQSFPKNEKLPIHAKLYTTYCNRKWRKLGSPAFTWTDYYKLHHDYWKKAASNIKYKIFSKEETAYIKEKAKQMGVSVNSYVIAAFLQADTNNRIVGIPVSVREDGNKSMTNLTSGISIWHRFSEKRSFCENARQIHQKVHKAIQKHKWFVLQFLSALSPTLLDGVLLNTYQCFQNRLVKQLGKVMGYTGDRDLGITNLTVLDIPTVYGAYKIEKLIFVPPAVSYARSIIGVSTINGEMTLTYHYMEDTKKEPEAFFDRSIQNLIR